MERTTAMVVKVNGSADDTVVRILEVRENEENPREMYEFWKHQTEGTLGQFEMVKVVTESI